MTGFGLSELGIVNALGTGPGPVAEALFGDGLGRLTPWYLKTTGVTVKVGAVAEPLPRLPERLRVYDCRNHRLAYAALLQIEEGIERLKGKYGSDRIGVVLGSSTAGLDATEEAYRIWKETATLPKKFDYQKQHAMGSVSGFVAEAAGLTGPAYTLSTACTSSVKAMVSARGLLRYGFCDAVVTGGVDTLCHMTLNGFEALGALSRTVSLPMSRNRTGLNIGEGAALFVLTRDPCTVQLRGAGESCDAYHMSAPHPEGEGAEAAMRAALDDAGLEPGAISYLNLHGTGTLQNDSMEAKAVARLFGNLPCSSSKPLIGHCLGAAGAMETAFCWLALNRDRNESVPLPPHHWDGQRDPDLAELDLVDTRRKLGGKDPLFFMSNSFAFGGNNCSVILERVPGFGGGP